MLGTIVWHEESGLYLFLRRFVHLICEQSGGLRTGPWALAVASGFYKLVAVSQSHLEVPVCDGVG